MFTRGDLYEMLEICERAGTGAVTVSAEKLKELCVAASELRSDAAKLAGICHALGIEKPATERPDYGHGFAGGSALEHEAQDK